MDVSLDFSILLLVITSFILRTEFEINLVSGDDQTRGILNYKGGGGGKPGGTSPHKTQWLMWNKMDKGKLVPLPPPPQKAKPPCPLPPPPQKKKS